MHRKDRIVQARLLHCSSYCTTLGRFVNYPLRPGLDQRLPSQRRLKTRARVEHVFADQRMCQGRILVRTKGKVRVEVKTRPMNLTYRLRRLEFLRRPQFTWCTPEWAETTNDGGKRGNGATTGALKLRNDDGPGEMTVPLR